LGHPYLVWKIQQRNNFCWVSIDIIQEIRRHKLVSWWNSKDSLVFSWNFWVLTN
jgi:hypothetical protein